MSHYFTAEDERLKSKPELIHFVIRDTAFSLTSDAGVFSKKGLDHGTRVLLKAISVPRGTRLLDLGCGYGPIGITLAKLDEAIVLMSDVNRRALTLAAANAKANDVPCETIESDGFAKIEGHFDVIVSNPPIRTGKETIYRLFAEAKEHLTEFGILYLVINKNQGANSAINYLSTLFPHVDVIDKSGGFYVIRCRIALTI